MGFYSSVIVGSYAGEKFEKTVSGAQIKALESVNDILAYMN